MYLLMNKDNVVASFEMRQDFGVESYSVTECYGKLPYGFQDINSWLENRKASKHNSHLKKLMKDCGCEKAEGFIRITHAASLNDTFWVKDASENISWSQISFYDNEFDETISRLAFEGIGLYGARFSSTSPEMTTNGSFRKCWRRENGRIFLYKRGQSGAVNAGLEPYSECMASEIAKILLPGAVSYHLAYLHGELASKCELFTNEKIGYVPISCVTQNRSLSNIMEFYAALGSEDEFRRMLVLDSLIFNTDRHSGNYGVLVDNNSMEMLKMAPVFDLNLSLLPYAMADDFEDVGTKLKEYDPVVGDDFTRIGQIMTTPEIRRTLINMKGFQFSFRGDRKFPEQRVQALEQIVNRQIDALLSKDILYTKDVFISLSAKEEIMEKQDRTKFEELEMCLIQKIADIKCVTYAGTQIFGEKNTLLINVSGSSGTRICICPEDCVVWMMQDGKEVEDVSNFLQRNETVDEAYTEVCRIVDDIAPN